MVCSTRVWAFPPRALVGGPSVSSFACSRLPDSCSFFELGNKCACLPHALHDHPPAPNCVQKRSCSTWQVECAGCDQLLSRVCWQRVAAWGTCVLAALLRRRQPRWWGTACGARQCRAFFLHTVLHAAQCSLRAAAGMHCRRSSSQDRAAVVLSAAKLCESTVVCRKGPWGVAPSGV